MDPPTLPTTKDSMLQEHSLPNVEEIRTDAAISSPSSNPKKSRRNLFLIVICVFSIAAIIGISTAIASSGGGSSSSTSALGGSQPGTSSAGYTGSTTNTDNTGDSDSPVNTKNSRHQMVQDFLAFFSEREDLERAGSPQFIASKWLADQDLRALEIPESTEYNDSFEFVQRYILTVFYYATGGDNWKFDTQFVSPRSECDWSFALKADAVIPASGSDNWVMGAGCNANGEVNKIFFPGNNLVGELPNELGLLIGLEHLSLFYNELAGNLPENLQYLSLVNFVAMESNLFTGPIPDWISEWTNLEYLALGDNQFSGELPSFAALDNLLELALDSNYLTGSVDVFNDALALEVLFLQNNGFDNEMDGDLFYYLENLRILDMHSNNLGGYLSPHFYNVEILDLHNNSISDAMPEITVDDSPLTFLSLFNNDFSGAIPDSISKLAGLTHLDLSLNGFTGAIPGSAINMLTDLVYLFLGDNPFAFGDFPNIWDLGLIQEISLKNARRGGSIPDWISSAYFPELVLLDLHTNGFDSALPTQLGTLSNLAFLLLNRNELTGSMPDSFNNLSNLALVFMDTNRMTGGSSPLCVNGPDISLMSADCKGEVACACCVICCAPDETNCNTQELQANIDDGYSRDQFIFSEDLIFNENKDIAT